MKIIDIKEVMSETGHASDSCLIWSAEDMRNAIEGRNALELKTKITDAQCKQLLDEFFNAYGDSIVSEIHELMSVFLSDKMEENNLGLITNYNL